MSRKEPELIDAALTHMFFFKKEPEKYGELVKSTPFFDFFNVSLFIHFPEWVTHQFGNCIMLYDLEIIYYIPVRMYRYLWILLKYRHVKHKKYINREYKFNEMVKFRQDFVQYVEKVWKIMNETNWNYFSIFSTSIK